jgi:hypothetical protein
VNVNRRFRLLRDQDGATNDTESTAGDRRLSGDWVRQAVSQIPMPSSPVDGHWEASVSAFVRPHLPPALRRVPQLLDRLGAVRLSPIEITVDSTSIAWTDVAEIRARPLSDVLTSMTIDGVRETVESLLPVSRLAKRPIRWLTYKLSEVVLSLFLIGLDERGDQQVPIEVIYRGRRNTEHAVTPGVLSAAVLALPKVAESTLATARAHGVRVILGPQPVGGVGMDFLRARKAELAARITGLRAAEAAGGELAVADQCGEV